MPDKDYSNRGMDPPRDIIPDSRMNGIHGTTQRTYSAWLGLRSTIGEALEESEDYCPFLYFFETPEGGRFPYCQKTNPVKKEIRAFLQDRTVETRCLTKDCRKCERLHDNQLFHYGKEYLNS